MATLPSFLRLPGALRTLRFRLAAWNAAIIILTAIVTLVGVRQGVHHALLKELDQVLADDLREVVSTVNDAPDGGLRPISEYLTRMAESHERHGWYVTLFNSSNAPIWSSSPTRSDRPRLPIGVGSAPASIDGFRILDKSLARPVAGVQHLRVGATLQFIDQDLARIDRLVLLAAGAVLISAPPCGYWLAARATRPVGEIIRTAARLRPSHLDERLTVRGTGDELDQLAETINKLLDRIAAYIDTKRDFLANAAHELRTPLAAIRSSVEVAMDGNCSAAEYEELLVDVIDECTSLETLVNQLLLLVETEAELPAARFEPVDLRELTLKSIDMFTGIAEVRGLALSAAAPAPAIINGNRNHLRQLVNNLLDNAVKYTSSPGTITVTLGDARDGDVTLEVTNSGPGISQEEQRLIFERFYRAESARSRGTAAGGTGLGLSICQSIVHNHGGQIECVSDKGRDTTFVVRLPRSEQPAEESAVA
jgi:signal transduction histidine kinase